MQKDMDTKQTKKEEKMKARLTKRKYLIVSVCNGRNKKRQKQTWSHRGQVGFIVLLWRCSWCTGLQMVSGRWSVGRRETGQVTNKSNPSFSRIWEVETSSQFDHKVRLTLFIFSRMQGFPSWYPKLESERPEQRLRVDLLKRQTFFVISSSSSCR